MVERINEIDFQDRQRLRRTSDATLPQLWHGLVSRMVQYREVKGVFNETEQD